MGERHERWQLRRHVTLTELVLRRIWSWLRRSKRAGRREKEIALEQSSKSHQPPPFSEQRIPLAVHHAPMVRHR